MQKQLLSILAMAGLSFGSFAQNLVPNGNFENWTNLTQSSERPTDWNSNKNGGGLATFGPQTCFRDTNAYSGSYCLKLVSGSVGSLVVNSSCATGLIEAPTAVPTEGYIADTGNVRNPFIGRPDSIVFWYKYTQMGSDFPNLQVRVHVGSAYAPETPVNNNHNDSSVNVIGRALWTGPAATQATWARVSVPMVYADSRTPEYILVSMTGSAGTTTAAAGSTFWVDDMQAIYNNGVASVKEIDAAPLNIYWNENNIQADLTSVSLTRASLQLMNIDGQLVLDAPLKGNSMNAISAQLPAGVYIYQVVSEERNVIGKTVKP